MLENFYKKLFTEEWTLDMVVFTMCYLAEIKQNKNLIKKGNIPITTKSLVLASICCMCIKMLNMTL